MRVRFEIYTIDTDARQLTRGGEALHLSPKAFDLLSMLVERRPAVVEKAALRQRLWPAVHVVETGLTNLVTEIRQVLGESKGGTPIVRTVHGVGYAFSAHGVDLDGARSTDGARAAPGWIVWNQRPIALARGENVVGRDATCGVWIDAGGVSRRHACIQVSGDGAMANATIEDLNSTNGTYVDGQRAARATPLQHGAKIRIGDATLVFRSTGADAKTKRVRPPKGGRSS